MAKLKKRGAAPGINLNTITKFLEEYVSSHYPDVGEFKFLERQMNSLIEAEKWTELGMLGFSIDKNTKRFKIYAIELLAYRLTAKGKEEENINLGGNPFTVCVCTDITNGGIATSSDIVYTRPYNKSITSVEKMLLSTVEDDLSVENWDNISPSSELDGTICISNEIEPVVLESKLKQLMKDKEDEENETE